VPLTAILNLRGRNANSGCSVLHWPQDLAVGSRVDDLVGGDAGEAVARDVADAVAARLDAVHVGVCEKIHDVGGVGEGDPVVLAVLPRREVAEPAVAVFVGTARTPVVVAGDAAEGAQLLRAQHAVRHGNAQHRRVTLDVPAVLQAQRPEIVVGQLAREMALQLVAELPGALVDEPAIEFCVAVHASREGPAVNAGPGRPECTGRGRAKASALATDAGL
jgi:hypothetical protein